MSNAVLPTFPGWAFGVSRKPVWTTTTKTSVSGREFRLAGMTSPRYKYKLNMEFLRDRQGHTEFRQLLGFFNARRGAWDTFLFDDRDDNAVTDQLFGIGDGTTTAYQLLRTLGTFLEPVYAPRTGAAQNLFSFPEGLENAAWTKAASTVGANQTVAPDGSLTADKLIENSTGPGFVFLAYQVVPAEAGYVNVSFYVKAAERHRVQVLKTGGGSNQARGFNLSTGLSFTNTQAYQEPVDFAITAAGNGWYRVSMTVSTDGSSDLTLAIELDNGSTHSYAGDGVSGAYVWGAMAVLGTSLVAYAPLRVYRTDWQGKQLLYATNRRNLVQFSEDFSSWNQTAVTVTTNAIAAPDGTTTADRVDGTGSGQRVHEAVTAEAASPMTFSVYVKTLGLTSSGVTLLLRNDTTSTNLTGVEFQEASSVITGGTLYSGAGTFAITAFANNWYRLSITLAAAEAPAIGNIIRAYVYMGDAAGATPNSSAYIWGAQLEHAGAMTSYIRSPAGSVTSVTDYTLDTNGLVTLSPAPSSGAKLSWTGYFYWRCRFLQDEVDFNEFYRNLWELKSLEFITVKP